LACCRACLRLSAQSACLLMGGLPAGTALQQHLGRDHEVEKILLLLLDVVEILCPEVDFVRRHVLDAHPCCRAGRSHEHTSRSIPCHRFSFAATPSLSQPFL
jgi:hypothetical protein